MVERITETHRGWTDCLMKVGDVLLVVVVRQRLSTTAHTTLNSSPVVSGGSVAPYRVMSVLTRRE